MNHSKTIGIDIAKRSFALHGADHEGNTVFRCTLKRKQLLRFLEDQPPCTVALECCGGAHFWVEPSVH